MAAPTTWTTQQDQQLTDLHAAGLSLRVCATRMGRSTSGVSDHAKRIGLSWDRSKTKAATDARVADNKARRAALESTLLVKADQLIAQIDAPHVVFNFGGKDNTYEEHLLKKPPTSDIRNLMQSAGIAIDRSLKLADHDGTGGDNAAAVDRWLTFMTGETT